MKGKKTKTKNVKLIKKVKKIKKSKKEVEKTYRCEICDLIPLIYYFLNDSNLLIKISCRNKHNIKGFYLHYFIKYVDEETEKNIDSICQKHSKKIVKICKDCNINICSECSHDCEGVMNIEDFCLSENEKNNIIENFNKFNPFFENLKKITQSHNDKYQLFYEKNKELLIFAKKIFSTYLKYEKEKNLSFEIIQNCRMCLKFQYKELILDNINNNSNQCKNLEKIEEYFKPENYFIIPMNIVNKSNYKLLTEYKIEKKYVDKYRYFHSYAELLDNKFAMIKRENIYIYNNDSLDILYTIHIDVYHEDHECEYLVPSLFTLKNGNLMVPTYDGKIYIFKIYNKSYKKILEIKTKEHFICAIELQNKKILALTNNKNFILYSYNKQKKTYELETRFLFDCSKELIYKAKILDINDSKNIIFITYEYMGYFNYKRGIYESKYYEDLDISLFDNNILLTQRFDILLKDKKNIVTKGNLLIDENQFLIKKICVLNDGSILCGGDNRCQIGLIQYTYINNNFIELSKLEFDELKTNIEFVYQLKNGNIICSIHRGSIVMLK